VKSGIEQIEQQDNNKGDKVVSLNFDEIIIAE
jgi:hypothetical protein